MPDVKQATNIFDLFPDLAEMRGGQIATCRCDKPALMIAMTARTGSTHLCESLGAAADIGCPAELFNPRGVVQVEKKKRGVSSFSEYMTSVANDSGQYISFKASWIDFEPLVGIYRNIFPDMKIIYLNRLDVVAQAVSLVLASTSGRWHDKSDIKSISMTEDEQSNQNLISCTFAMQLRTSNMRKRIGNCFSFLNS